MVKATDSFGLFSLLQWTHLRVDLQPPQGGAGHFTVMDEPITREWDVTSITKSLYSPLKRTLKSYCIILGALHTREELIV